MRPIMSDYSIGNVYPKVGAHANRFIATIDVDMFKLALQDDKFHCLHVPRAVL